MLSLAALAACGAAVVPALGAIDAHSAPLRDAPFGTSASVPASADTGVGSEWRAVVALP